MMCSWCKPQWMQCLMPSVDIKVNHKVTVYAHLFCLCPHKATLFPTQKVGRAFASLGFTETGPKSCAKCPVVEVRGE